MLPNQCYKKCYKGCLKNKEEEKEGEEKEKEKEERVINASLGKEGSFLGLVRECNLTELN